MLEVFLARGAIGSEASKLILLFVGVLVVSLALRFPMATALVMIFLTDFIFFPLQFAKQVGPMSIRPHEVAMVLLLGLAIFRPKRRTWGGTAGIALIVFLGLVGASDMVAIARHATTFKEALSWARPLLMLTLFFVVIRLFPTAEERRTLLLGAAVIAAATGLVACAAAFNGGLKHTLEAASPETIREEGGEGGLARVRLPGLAVGYGLFWYAVTQIAARRGSSRWLWSALLLGIAADIAISFNRNMWIGVVAGLFLMAAFGGQFMRGRLATSVGTIVALLAALVIFGGSTTNGKLVEPVLKRGETIFNPSKTSQEASVTERERETSVAWKTVQSHPLLGVGAGASYGMLITQSVGSASLIVGYVQIPQLFLHNQYLYLILISGLGGLVAFVIFLGTPLLAAVRREPRDPAIVACGVAIAMIMLSAVVAIYFTAENMTTVLGLLTGVIIADREGWAANGVSSGLLD